MYEWRKMNEDERQRELVFRTDSLRPPHSPPHSEAEGWNRFHLSAANYEHAMIIGESQKRMQEFSHELCAVLAEESGVTLFAWSVLPNHWHALIGCVELGMVLKRVGRLHGSSSYKWNGEDGSRGRKCWHCCADRWIRSDRHFYVVRNYIHNNPVKHGYVKKWEDWEFSSAVDFLNEVGRDEASRLWCEYPVLDMGEKWDF